MALLEQQRAQAAAAGFTGPLAYFIETNDGHHTFCYPLAYGALRADLDRALSLVRDAAGSRGTRVQKTALGDALAHLVRVQQTHGEIERQWDRHCAARGLAADAEDRA